MIRTILNSVKVTETGDEPVSLDLTKLYLGIGSNTHDVLLGTLIPSARKEVEAYCKRKFIECTVKAYFNSINEYTYLPFSPVISITSVTDSNDAEVSYTKTLGENPRVKLTTESEVVIEYECGSEIEEDLKLCVIKKVGEDFEFRTGISVQPSLLLPNNWMATALKHRNTWLM